MPPMPVPGTNPYNVGAIVGNWRWTGVGWEDAGTQSQGGGGGDFGLGKILDEYKRQQEERNRLMKEFEGKNPFVFDEVLAQKQLEASEQLDPWYKQVMGDFLTGIQRQRSRGVEDERRLLGELETDVGQYTEQSKANLELALERAKEGSSQVGLLQSGIAERKQGLVERETGTNLEDFLTTAGRRKTDIQRDTTRSLEDLQRKESMETRDIERERKAQTNLLGSQLTRETGVKREYARRQFLGP